MVEIGTSNKIDESENDIKYEDIDCVSADFSNNSRSDDERCGSD